MGSGWFQLVLAFVVTGLVLSFVAKPFWVPSGSMEATLQPGDRVLVNRLATSARARPPATSSSSMRDRREPPVARENPLKSAARWIGEVTGFGPSSAHTLVKRVIGAPGQTVACCSADGAVIVDGEPLDEPYVSNNLAFDPGVLDCDTSPRSQRCFDEVTVPDASYLMLGDNRANSADSAYFCRGETTPGCWRWATREGIIGKAVLLFRPITRWQLL